MTVNVFVSSERVRNDIVEDVTQYEGMIDSLDAKRGVSLFDIAVEYVCHLDDVANSVHDTHVCSHCRRTLTDGEQGYFNIKKELLNRNTLREHYLRIRRDKSTTDWIVKDKGGRSWLCREVHVASCNDCKLRRFDREYADVIINDAGITEVQRQIDRDHFVDGYSNLDNVRFERPRFSYTSGGGQWDVPFASVGAKLALRNLPDPLIKYKRTLAALYRLERIYEDTKPEEGV